ISPMNQTGTRIQSLQSEPSQMKTIQDSNMRALKSYEQQCIEELRISNALLYEQYNLYRNKNLDESCTQVRVTVEQDTSLNTSEARFPLESPCVASTCPHRNIFPCENIVLPGNPRSTNGCLRSYPVMVLIFVFNFLYHQIAYLACILSKCKICINYDRKQNMHFSEVSVFSHWIK
uniref:DUF3496 domain-containing protein n=1 Tax=Peromyscus maniculatus bairdii TaxID=230844 RepID=A0A8C8UJM4_PERMB